VLATPAKAASMGCTTVAGQATYGVAVAGGTGPCSGPASAASAQVTGSSAAAPTIKNVVITPSVAFSSFGNGASGGGGTPNGSFYSEAGVPGTATVTYNTTVNCLGAAGSDFSYSNSGGSGTVTGTSCQQPTGTASNQLVITLAQVSKSGSGSTATFSQTSVVTPGNGDTFAYTVPSPQTTANSVYAGTAGSPTYAATQSVGSNGTASSSSNVLGTGTGVPVIGNVQVNATGVVGTEQFIITYNEVPTCPAAALTAAQAAQFVYQVKAGAAVTPIATATCGVVGNTMTITGLSAVLAAVGVGDTFTYTSDGVAGDRVTSPDSVTVLTDGALTPNGVAAVATDASEPTAGGQGALWET